MHQTHLHQPSRAPASPDQPVSMVLIDDNPSSREGIVALLRRQPGFKVLATSSHIEDVLRLVGRSRPEIVLIHLGKDDDDALTLAGALHGEAPSSRVVIMGLPPRRTDVESFVRARVAGFIMADATFTEFLDTVHRIVSGEQVLPPDLAGVLFTQLTRSGVRWRPKPVAGAQKLTVREREVADLIVQGLSNKEIASRMGIALHTVKSHVHKVLSKLACNSRLEVAAFAQYGARRAPPEQT